MKTLISTRRMLLCATVLSSIVGINSAAQAQTWNDISGSSVKFSVKDEGLQAQIPTIRKSRLVRVEDAALRSVLNQAPDEQFGTSQTYIDLPLPHGEMRRYAVQYSPIMAPALAKKFPSIQTYRVTDVNDPDNTGRLDITPSGFHAVLSFGDDTVFIDPVGAQGEYQSYFKSDYTAERSGHNHAPFTCGSHAKQAHDNHQKRNQNYTPFAQREQKFSFGSNLRTYRLAVAATGEFSQFHGGTTEGAMSAIITGINRVNQVYERDVAVRLQLVDNNSDVIFLDAASDPFTDDDADALIEEVTAEINEKIGSANYDIGHVFSTGGGGLASFGVVCGDQKAEGVTGSSQPVNDPFFIDFVAHEFGHQFAAAHTFNGLAESCTGNRAADSAYEPGSGSTIMAYASLCGEEDIQPLADAYFHARSIEQISEFVANSARGGSCGATISLNNRIPVPDAGSDGQIPQSTPFILAGSATDADAGDTLSYAWEQYDLGAATRTQAQNVDDGTRPLFRSFPPKSAPTRTFPQPSDVLTGTSTFGETLPTTDRELNFRFTVRDSKGGVAADDMKLTVNAAAGPFTVTAPDTASWQGGTRQTITWDVANTTAAPISCSAVDVDLSDDGGQTFSIVVASGTANDGSETITVPNIDTTTGRLRIKCASQPFFAVNTGTISVAASTNPPPNQAPVAVADSFTVNQDSGVTNFAVLLNDSDADGDTLTVSAISDISNGGTVANAGGEITYRPASEFSGTETFNYTVSDGNGGTASAQVTVTVTPAPPPNSAPVANNDSFTVDQDSGATRFSVLNNDTDADGDTLSIATVGTPSNGGTATVDGTAVSYQPANGYSGTETISYSVSDGTATSNTATITVTVTAAPAPPPPPPPPPVTTTSSSGGGGGSFGLFMLLLLGAARKIKALRLNRGRNDEQGMSS